MKCLFFDFYFCQAEKRAHHNALERKRRDHIKDSFTSLRDSVPSLQGEKVVSSLCPVAQTDTRFLAMNNNEIELCGNLFRYRQVERKY